MKMSDQVCNVGQGKILHQLLGSEAVCNYYRHVNIKDPCVLFEKLETHKWRARLVEWGESDVGLEDYMVPAFTVAELTMMLPLEIEAGITPLICKLSTPNRWVTGVYYQMIEQHTGKCSYEPNYSLYCFHCRTQAEATAAMVIALLMSKVITPEYCINQLKSYQ